MRFCLLGVWGAVRALRGVVPSINAENVSIYFESADFTSDQIFQEHNSVDYLKPLLSASL